MTGIKYLKKRIKSVASGIVVISSYLQNKYEKLTKHDIPIHYRSVSVDFDHFIPSPLVSTGSKVLFYSGSFGKKDGVSVLLDAFDTLASKYASIRLVLTGKGSDEAMYLVRSRILVSPYKERIEYKGYLDDKTYYDVLNSIDIPCMTRIDLTYANAGFPFKLGEFLATGKPVIASHVSDVERFLNNRSEAMLVKPGDSSAIVDAVEYLIEKPNRAAAIGKKGREKARALFNYQEQGHALYLFLRSL